MAAGRCRRPLEPRERLGGGLVAPDHHATQGGPRDPRSPLGGAHHRARVSGASWKHRLMGSCVIEHGMKAVNPRMRMRWRQAKALTLHVLKRRLLHRPQHDEPCVGDRGSRTRVVRPVTAARTGVPLTRAGLPIGRSRGLNRRQQRGTCGLR